MFSNYNKGRCYIIAEIGGNFTNFEQAKKLIDAAAECEVDAVKLQTYRADTIASKKAIFDMENTGVTSQYDLFKKYEIDEGLHKEVFQYAESKSLDWFSTPSHESDVDLLDKLNVGAHKVGSDDAVNLPFLKYVARTGKPILLSTGMCTLSEVEESVSAILGEGNQELILLHAITSYPTHAPDVNLNAIKTLQAAFPNLAIGYSDHTLSSVACLCAVALGAMVIEKHFTYDKQADGPDHMLSADPGEMKWLVNAIRTYETMSGTGVKCPAPAEKTTRVNNRKSLIINKNMSKGQYISLSDIAIKRPGSGIGPKFYEQVLGRVLLEDMEEDDVLTWEIIS